MPIDKEKIRVAAMAATQGEWCPCREVKQTDEIAELKRQLEVANEQADIHRQWNLGYMRSNDAHRTALRACLARERNLRDALKTCIPVIKSSKKLYYCDDLLVSHVLSLPRDDAALIEYRNEVIEACAVHTEEKYDLCGDELVISESIRNLKLNSPDWREPK